MGLLVVTTDDGNQGIAKSLELVLGRWVEEWQRGQVDRLIRVRVDLDGRASSGGLAAVAQAQSGITKKILGVFEIRFLLGTSQPLKTLSGCFFVLA